MSFKHRALSAPPVKRNAFPGSKQSGSSIFAASGSGSGGADEETFIRAFENDVPRVQIFTGKDLEQELSSIKDMISDSNHDWEKRTESMKRIRSLLIAGAQDYDELYAYLKYLELPMQLSVKDLRSKVVRETCITIAYLSQRLGIKCDRFAEALLPSLINLILNSAKIMSTSAIVTIRFIIQHTHAPRLIPIITYNLTSKSKEIRKACLEFLVQLLHTWPAHTLEKHVAILQEAIKRGLNDADSEARAYARKAFWGFSFHFKDHANCLMNSLDSSKQRMLYGEQQPPRTVNSCVSSSSSVENLSRSSSNISGLFKPRTGIPIFSPKDSILSRSIPYTTMNALDLGLSTRTKAKSVYSAPGYSLPRSSPKKSEPLHASPERVGRSKNRVSQSLPGSRSASPMTRYNYHPSVQVDRGTRLRRKSGIPVSTSRETSPTRASVTGTNYATMERRLNSSGRSRFSSFSERGGYGTTLLAEKILQQSQEAEFAVADALTSPAITTKRPQYVYDDQSDESETSSICSDRSFGGRNVEDVSEIIRNLSSSHWSDRKEGLMGLQFFLKHSTRSLNAYELKRITDIFTKMLLDPHTKTFTLFLDILHELIGVYKQDLGCWLYILMTRLFLKMGTDTLQSVHDKILKTFVLIRESFTCEDQFNVIIRFLSDQTQTPNAKVKITVLQYLVHLTSIMDPSEWNSSNINNHELQLTLMKIISWTADPKSQELRKNALEVILALFNLNTPEFSSMLNLLPKTYQDAAFQSIHMKLKQQNESSAFTNISSNIASLQTAGLLKPNNGKTPSPGSKFNDFDDTENLNPEEIYNSLKQTSDEIQKYNYDIESENATTRSIVDDIGPLVDGSGDFISPKKTSLSQPKGKDFASNSQDSGISQIDSSSNHKNTPTSTPSSLNSSPLKQTVVNDAQHTSNGFSNFRFDQDCEMSMENNDLFCILGRLRNKSEDIDSYRESLSRLTSIIRDGNSTDWDNHFKEVFKVILEKISDEQNSSVRAIALRVMCDLLMKQTKYFHDYIELTILRILEASKDNEKEVHRAAEACAGAAAAVLPPELCLRVLKTVITTGELPMNQAAIKMLAKLVEQHPKHIIHNLLPDMMPALVHAYDNPESSVRKAAVFSMVGVHSVVGDEMKPYLISLNASKMKLLKLYIEREKSKTESSGCNSPISPAGNFS